MPEQLQPIDYALIAITLGVMLVLNLPGLRRNRLWSVTITPLASIIGSGFLVVAPLLRDIAGPWALAAMGAIVVLAWYVGAVIRYNIRHAEPQLPRCQQGRGDPLMCRSERLSSWVLSVAYVISVAFYINLLAAYALDGLGLKTEENVRWLSTAVLGLIGLVGLIRGLEGLEWMEKFTVALKLAVIAALLAGLAWYDLHHPYVLPSPNPDLSLADKLRMLAGTLLVVQGFETVRYMGNEYPADLRIRGMKLAQLISGAIYLAFIALVTPLLVQLAPGQVSETALIQISRTIALSMPLILIIGAIMAQFSAAVADTAGAGGLLHEETRGRLNTHLAYALIALLAIGLIWLANIFEIIAYASRAFAFYYFLQAVIALRLSMQRGETTKTLGFAVLALLLLAITLFAKAVG
jgi:hypothetical protein